MARVDRLKKEEASSHPSKESQTLAKQVLEIWLPEVRASCKSAGMDELYGAWLWH